MIQRAKDAQVVGIVVGTLGVGNVRAIVLTNIIARHISKIDVACLFVG